VGVPLLDMRTVFISYVLTTGLCAVFMTSLWLQNKQRSPEIVLWFVDYLMQVVGLVLIVARGTIPDFLSIVGGNVLVILGTILLYVGLQRYLGKETRQLHNWIMLAAFAVVHTYFTFADPSLRMRNVNSSAALFFIAVQCAWLLLNRADAEDLPATRPAGIAFAGFCAAGGFHLVTNLTVPSVHELFDSGILDSAAVITYQIFFVALTFGLFLLVSRRLSGELAHDIAERMKAEEALRKSEQKFAAAFQTVPDGVVITWRSDGTIIEANQACFDMLGFTKGEEIGKTTLDLGIWNDPSDRNRYLEQLASTGHVVDFNCMLRRKSGEVFPCVVSGEVLEVGGREALLTVIHDATASKEAEARLRELSDHDPLTSVLNYRAFYELACERLAQMPSDSRAALVFMDLDGLKEINDEFGHPAGDQALVVFADVLRTAFRDSDVIARMGGDEFVVLAMTRGSGDDDALLTRFHEKLAQSNAASGLPFEV